MEKKLIVKAGFHNRKFSPASYNLKEELEKVTLVDVKSGEQIPSQIEGGILSWIIEDLKAGEEREHLLSDQEGSQFPGVEIEEKSETADVKIPPTSSRSGRERTLFTTYHFGRSVARPFLNPVIGPNGDSMVRELFEEPQQPDHDHIHHRGVLVAHGDVNGVNDWDEEEGHGFIRHNSFREIISGAVYGKIEAENWWVSEEGEKVLSEIRTMKFYNISEVRIIDFEILFRATEGDVTFGDTKEGGILSVRVPTPIRADRKGKIENAYGGINESETWGKRAPWCDYSGPLNSGMAGIAILDHPDNFRYPTYWHVRNYGLMTANPFALSYYYNDKTKDGSHTLETGKKLKFCYRLYLHRGYAKEGRVSEAFHDYINPPEVDEVK
ncbi:MAG TPA: hypothetical protein EYP78_04040 [Candidatus Omnitrophica bacterium]|nr:hypothetical protein [Candidatus Omnitrophota bacterium]